MIQSVSLRNKSNERPADSYAANWGHGLCRLTLRVWQVDMATALKWKKV